MTILDKSGIASLALPDGWSSWTHAGRWLSIAGPRALCTIDAEVRCFRAGGNNTYGPTIGAATYSGRGWAARLHADAVAWLRKASEES
jgi:hypothetical protein